MREIVVGSKGQFRAIVSDVDFDFLNKWSWTFARSHPGARRELIYARRSVRVEGPPVWSDAGAVPGPKVPFDLFMHHAVLTRMGEPEPPEPDWTADHLNTKTLDNMRGNLTWASPTFQALNRAGSHKRAGDHGKKLREIMARLAETHTFPIVSEAAILSAIPF